MNQVMQLRNILIVDCALFDILQENVPKIIHSFHSSVNIKQWDIQFEWQWNDCWTCDRKWQETDRLFLLLYNGILVRHSLKKIRKSNYFVLHGFKTPKEHWMGRFHHIAKSSQVFSNWWMLTWSFRRVFSYSQSARHFTASSWQNLHSRKRLCWDTNQRNLMIGNEHWLFAFTLRGTVRNTGAYINLHNGNFLVIKVDVPFLAFSLSELVRRISFLRPKAINHLSQSL